MAIVGIVVVFDLQQVPKTARQKDGLPGGELAVNGHGGDRADTECLVLSLHDACPYRTPGTCKSLELKTQAQNEGEIMFQLVAVQFLHHWQLDTRFKDRLRRDQLESGRSENQMAAIRV